MKHHNTMRILSIMGTILDKKLLHLSHWDAHRLVASPTEHIIFINENVVRSFYGEP